MTRSSSVRAFVCSLVILSLSATAPGFRGRGVDRPDYAPETAQVIASPPGSQLPTNTNGEDLTTLEFGKLIERELAGGQKHIYQIVLSQGQFMKVEISDSGVDVSLLFQLPNGETGHDWTAFRRQEIK